MGTLVAGLVLEFAVALTPALTTAVALGLDGLVSKKRAHQARPAHDGRVAYSRPR